MGSHGEPRDPVVIRNLDAWIRYLIEARAESVDEYRCGQPVPQAAERWLRRGRPERRAPR